MQNRSFAGRTPRVPKASPYPNRIPKQQPAGKSAPQTASTAIRPCGGRPRGATASPPPTSTTNMASQTASTNRHTSPAPPYSAMASMRKPHTKPAKHPINTIPSESCPSSYALPGKRQAPNKHMTKNAFGTASIRLCSIRFPEGKSKANLDTTSPAWQSRKQAPPL